LGGGGNDAVKNTNTNEIQILFAGYHKPAKLGKNFLSVNSFNFSSDLCNASKSANSPDFIFLF
jgi:hypothetical protein